MAWAIKRPGLLHRLHSAAVKGMVINDYTGEPRHFATRSLAKSYAELSCMSDAEVVETK